MKYIKTYEFNGLNYNDIYNFLKKIVKIIDKKYSVNLSKTNVIYLHYKDSDDISEIISEIKTNVDVLIFHIYNTKYELNKLLVEYFTFSMEKIYDKNYTYSFKYKSDTKLKIKDFETFINANKYNL